ncbi:LOW QUALITY PROTEIN: ABC_tran domain-containing protein/ABC_membrane domain-containing protein, partial [Cephalotus follicularis]
KVSFYKLFAFADTLDVVLMILGTVCAIFNGISQPLITVITGHLINAFATTSFTNVIKEVSKMMDDARYSTSSHSLYYSCVRVCSVPSCQAHNSHVKEPLYQLRRPEVDSCEKLVQCKVINRRFYSSCLVGDAMGLIVQNIATIIVGLVISFSANWILAFIILVNLPLILLQGYLQTKFYEGFSFDAKVMYEEASQVANDAVGSIRTVASFCAEQKVMDLYQNMCNAPIKHGVHSGLVSGGGFAFSLFTLSCTVAFCFYIGAVLVLHGKCTYEDVFRVFFSLTLTAVGVSQTTALAPDTNKAKDSATSIFDILDSKPKIDSSNNDGITLTNVNGDIEFEHVCFKYPTRPDVQIFKDWCLTIPSGKTVALVGESGSGKSTIISLIQRFYDLDSGKIFLDNVEIRKFKLSWRRQQIGLVSQEPILFNETIRANIAYGKQGDATEEEIITATKAANAHNFISSLPQGYYTSVGERGVQLSGGQKQRVAIARAILKNPKILLLDEATSALDAESERVVQDALDRVMVNRTTIVVANRLSTIKNANTIIVLKNGVIVEKGKHEVLIKITGGAYASLVAL